MWKTININVAKCLKNLKNMLYIIFSENHFWIFYHSILNLICTVNWQCRINWQQYIIWTNRKSSLIMTKMPVNVSSCCILALLICSRYVKFPDCISKDDFAWLYYLSIHFKMQIWVVTPHLIPYECLLSYSTGSRTSHPTCRPLPVRYLAQ